MYFYLEGSDWRVGISLPAGIQINANEYVTLEMDTDKPYQYHSEVVKRYPPGLQKEKAKGKEKNSKGKGKEKKD